MTNKQYFTLSTTPDSGVHPVDHIGSVMSHIFEAFVSLDPDVVLHKTSSLPFSPSQISKDTTHAEFKREWLRFLHVANPYSLVKVAEDAVDDEGEPVKPRSIYGTFLIETSVPPDVLISECLPVLSSLEVRLFDKQIQTLRVETIGMMLGVSTGFDPNGIDDRMKMLLQRYQRTRGHSRLGGEVNNETELILKAKVRTIRLSNNHQGKESFESLPKRMQDVHMAFHFDCPSEQAPIILDILSKAEKDGKIVRLFGMQAGFVRTGKRASRDKSVQLEVNKQIKNHHQIQLYFTVVDLDGLVYPFGTFNVELADGTTPRGKGKKLNVLMKIQGSDTKGHFTKVPIILCVLCPSSGRKNGITQVCHRDDRRGTGGINGGKRKTDGPHVSIMGQVLKNSSYFLGHFMRSNLGFSDGTIASALSNGASFEHAVTWQDNSTFNPVTLELRVAPEFQLSSTAADRGQAQLDTYASEEKPSDFCQQEGGESSEPEDEEEERKFQKFIANARIVHPDCDKRVGGDGASVRTNASEVSSVARSMKSDATHNMRDSYIAAKKKNIAQMNTIAAQDDRLEAMKREQERLVGLVAKLSTNKDGTAASSPLKATTKSKRRSRRKKVIFKKRIGGAENDGDSH